MRKSRRKPPLILRSPQGRRFDGAGIAGRKAQSRITVMTAGTASDITLAAVAFGFLGFAFTHDVVEQSHYTPPGTGMLERP